MNIEKINLSVPAYISFCQANGLKSELDRIYKAKELPEVLCFDCNYIYWPSLKEYIKNGK